jgi:hypothetical protein
LPDPNLPENSATIRAMKERVKAEFQLFMKGPGKPLFEKMSKKLKSMTVLLYTINQDDMCGCKACSIIREMQLILKLWLEIESTIGEKNG